MKKILITTMVVAALVMAFVLPTPALADGPNRSWYTSQFDTVAVLGQTHVIFSAKSGLQFVLDSALLAAGADTDATLQMYKQGSTLINSASKAITVTTISFANTTSAVIAHVGDILYVPTRGDDPSDSSMLFYGEISAVTFSDTADTEIVTRTASESDGTLAASTTVTLGHPWNSTDGSAVADNIFVGTLPTDDNEAILIHAGAGNGIFNSATAMVYNGLCITAECTEYPDWLVPRGAYSKDVVFEFTSGAGTDGEIVRMNGHYEAKK